METTPKHDLAAVMAGMIDVQFMMLLLIRAQLDLKHSDLIERLEAAGRLIDRQGGGENYVASRRVAVDTLLSAMRYVESLVNANGEIEPSSTRPALSVIVGGMADVVSTPQGVPGMAGVSEKIKE